MMVVSCSLMSATLVVADSRTVALPHVLWWLGKGLVAEKRGELQQQSPLHELSPHKEIILS